MTTHDQRARAATEEMRAVIRAACRPCNGTGILSTDTRGNALECEYCGRQMQAVTPDIILRHFPNPPTSEAVEAIRNRVNDPVDYEWDDCLRDEETLLAAHDALAREVVDLRAKLLNQTNPNRFESIWPV